MPSPAWQPEERAGRQRSTAVNPICRELLAGQGTRRRRSISDKLRSAPVTLLASIPPMVGGFTLISTLLVALRSPAQQYTRWSGSGCDSDGTLVCNRRCKMLMPDEARSILHAIGMDSMHL